MRLTERDVKLLRDLTLSHVLSRDQILELGYFGSVTRVNTRLRGLKDLGLVEVIDTPFFSQKLYKVMPKAAEIVGRRLSALATARIGSPRFLQHALTVTNVRIALKKNGAEQWLFEQQLRNEFRYGGRTYEVRPDGMATERGVPLLIEADLGHVSLPKLTEKLKAYNAFVLSGECTKAWLVPTYTVLFLVPGQTRASRVSGLLANPVFTLRVKTLSSLEIPSVGNWS